MKPIQTSVIGVGLGGLTFHCSFILALPQFALHSVVERNPTSPGGKVKQRYGHDIKIYNTSDELFADQDIELVVVSTPNTTHFQLAKTALLAGKHVLLDKPVTLSVKDAQELGAIADAKALVLYAFQNRRWDSDFLSLRKLLDLPFDAPQSLGHLIEFESHYDRYKTTAYGTWKDDPSAGLIWNLGPHLIDQSLLLFGRPQKLTAFLQNIRKLGDPECDDSFTIYMHYAPSSARPHPFTVILRAQPLSVLSPQLSFFVRGTKGTFLKYGLDVQEDQLKAMVTVDEIFSPTFGKEPQAIWGTISNIDADEVSVTQSVWPSEAGSYIELFKDLASTIRDGIEPSVKWKEATGVIEVIELAQKSSREGVTVYLDTH